MSRYLNEWEHHVNENFSCNKEVITGEKLIGTDEHLFMLIPRPESLLKLIRAY